MLTMYLSVIDIESEKLDFEKFYRLYKDDVYAYARSLLKTRERGGRVAKHVALAREES